MFKVTRRGNGFQISIGDRRPAQTRGRTEAENVSEAQQALAHYYCTPYHATLLTDCPFCRAMAKAGLAPTGEEG